MSCFLIVVVIWVFSVCLHEYGHAIVAYYGGDTSVEEKGYLSMNPIYYADPVNSFVLPMVFMILGGIGLPGGAVYINKHLLRSRGWDTAVSLAGPAMNLIEAIVLVVLLRLVFIPHYPGNVATYAVAFAFNLEISAILFNLIPVPPLDGFQALEPWLTHEWRQHLVPLSRWGLIVLFLLMWNVEPLNHAFWFCVWSISSFVGIDPELGYHGYELFRFWQQ